MTYSLEQLFGLSGKVAVITGGSGVLCGEMARALGDLGVKVAILGRDKNKAQKVVDQISAAGGTAMAVATDVLDKAALEEARQAITAAWGPADILINGAGGNNKTATTGGVNIADQLDPTFFDLDPAGIQFVFNVNFIGTLLATQVFSRDMVDRKVGNIVNISSMSAFTPLTKVMSYSAAKAAINSFTAWLATHMAPANVRVNAIAPGFFLTEQNRFLLTDEKTGDLTPRGNTIISATPMKRFGEAAELISALVYLLAPTSGFTTGTVVPVDGGFNAFSGV